MQFFTTDTRWTQVQSLFYRRGTEGAEVLSNLPNVAQHELVDLRFQVGGQLSGQLCCHHFMGEKSKVQSGNGHNRRQNLDLNSGFSDSRAQALPIFYWLSSFCQSGTSRSTNHATELEITVTASKQRLRRQSVDKCNVRVKFFSFNDREMGDKDLRAHYTEPRVCLKSPSFILSPFSSFPLPPTQSLSSSCASTLFTF